MEIYVNSPERAVSINIPVTATTMDAAIFKNGTKVYDVPTVNFTSGVYTFQLPFRFVNQPAELVVIWAYSYNEGGVQTGSHSTQISVVQPVVDVERARLELEIPVNITDEQIRLTERRVRMMIENATGQRFYAYTGQEIGTVLGDGSIRLPHRLLSLTSVGDIPGDLYYVLADSGWRLAINYPRKRDGIRAGEVPITDPFAQWRKPQVTKTQVTGRWGWEQVPTDIQEAALILMEQQLCPDSLYRERYLKTMTAADFRFEFDAGAYVGTGNVIADQILAKYVNHLMAII